MGRLKVLFFITGVTCKWYSDKYWHSFTFECRRFLLLFFCLTVSLFNSFANFMFDCVQFWVEKNQLTRVLESDEIATSLPALMSNMKSHLN